MAVVMHSRAAIAGVCPALGSGGPAGSVSTRPMEALRAVEVWRHGWLDVELQARLSNLHMMACAHPGDRGVGSALGDARRCLTPLERRLLPAVAMETVEAFLRAAGASL